VAGQAAERGPHSAMPDPEPGAGVAQQPTEPVGGCGHSVVLDAQCGRAGAGHQHIPPLVRRAGREHGEEVGDHLDLIHAADLADLGGHGAGRREAARSGHGQHRHARQGGLAVGASGVARRTDRHPHGVADATPGQRRAEGDRIPAASRTVAETTPGPVHHHGARGGAACIDTDQHRDLLLQCRDPSDALWIENVRVTENPVFA